MAKVIVIGSGFAGHTAALYLGDALGRQHQIAVVNKLENFSYIPSWVWVGVGQMKASKTIFPLAPVYKKRISVSCMPRFAAFFQSKNNSRPCGAMVPMI